MNVKQVLGNRFNVFRLLFAYLVPTAHEAALELQTLPALQIPVTVSYPLFAFIEKVVNWLSLSRRSRKLLRVIQNGRSENIIHNING